MSGPVFAVQLGFRKADGNLVFTRRGGGLRKKGGCSQRDLRDRQLPSLSSELAGISKKFFAPEG